MNRTLVKTIHNNEVPFWLITLWNDQIHQEFAVYSPDIDTAIYEVLTHTNSTKSAIVSITKN
jgi:hypothetical protein